MSDELRKAAERLRKVNAITQQGGRTSWDTSWDDEVADIYGVSRNTDSSDIMALVENDRYDLSEAYLAANPADSDEPVTEEWLSENTDWERDSKWNPRWQKLSGSICIVKNRKYLRLSVAIDDHICIQLDNCYLLEGLITRRQVRNLIAALEGR